MLRCGLNKTPQMTAILPVVPAARCRRADQMTDTDPPRRPIAIRAAVELPGRCTAPLVAAAPSCQHDAHPSGSGGAP
ncbi:unnamed protein product [Nezara viridula]|uniref:Uncharacterized protein n=1 Tax=Nezara viridula TaxID=85310 RepID=A0A9P0HL41_NEZVI|nr:unnamed protein product [Nezara viridula]